MDLSDYAVSVRKPDAVSSNRLDPGQQKPLDLVEVIAFCNFNICVISIKTEAPGLVPLVDSRMESFNFVLILFILQFSKNFSQSGKLHKSSLDEKILSPRS